MLECKTWYHLLLLSDSTTYRLPRGRDTAQGIDPEGVLTLVEIGLGEDGTPPRW